MTEVDYPTPIESLLKNDRDAPSSSNDQPSQSGDTIGQVLEAGKQHGSKLTGDDGKEASELIRARPSSSPPPPPVNNPWTKNNPPAKVSQEEGIMD